MFTAPIQRLAGPEMALVIVLLERKDEKMLENKRVSENDGQPDKWD